MDNSSRAIEFKSMPYHSDLEDLSQECTAYMKTKQFMAKRIHEQQEEIEYLRQNVTYLSSKLIQAEEMVVHMGDQVNLLKETIKLEAEKKLSPDDFDMSNSELASSFVYEDSCQPEVPKNTLKLVDFDNLKNENFQLRKDLENSRIQILDTTIALNKTKSDKFILFNELNELVMSLKKIDLEKLNSFYKINSDKIFNKNEMPIAKGIKYNILSAQSQLCKIMITDSISKKLNLNEDCVKDENLMDRRHMEIYNKILKKNEDDFDKLLDKKLSKRTAGIIIY